MKTKFKTEKEYNVKTLLVSAKVRYWEDSCINGITDTKDGSLVPCKNGKNWDLTIDVETGIITNWVKGITANIHYKVCDDGKYTLLDEYNNELVSYESYVPNCLCPKEDGYGDYIIMDINENGKINNFEMSFEEWKYIN
jgi:hypothetical protein